MSDLIICLITIPWILLHIEYRIIFGEWSLLL